MKVKEYVGDLLNESAKVLEEFLVFKKDAEEEYSIADYTDATIKIANLMLKVQQGEMQKSNLEMVVRYMNDSIEELQNADRQINKNTTGDQKEKL